MFVRACILFLTTFAFVSVAARAQPPASEGAPATVVYGDVDAATVRVFTFAGVDMLRGTVWNAPTVVAIPRAGHGSGFVVGDGRLVVTANHVVRDARSIVVRLPGDRGVLTARVVARDEAHDLAVLAIATALPHRLRLAPEAALRVRQTVFAVGYPLDPTRTQAQSSRGIVAGRTDDGYLQLDMALNPGNSGGPLVDETDAAVGLVFARGDVQAGVQGIGFAVPGALIAPLVDEATRALASAPPAPDGDGAVAVTRMVDAFVQLGVLGGVRAADDLRRGRIDRTRLAAIEASASAIEDPDALVLAAATLWNASLVLTWTEGNAAGAAWIRDRAIREAVLQLAESASRLCRKAIERDGTVAVRSPFARHAAMTGGRR